MAIKELGCGYSEYLKDCSDNEITIGNDDAYIKVYMVDGIVKIVDGHNTEQIVNQLKPESSIQDWIIDNL